MKKTDVVSSEIEWAKNKPYRSLTPEQKKARNLLQYLAPRLYNRVNMMAGTGDYTEWEERIKPKLSLLVRGCNTSVDYVSTLVLTLIGPEKKVVIKKKKYTHKMETQTKMKIYK